MSEFERLLKENYLPLERFVKFKVSNSHDAQDIIQEVCFTATTKFDTLKNHSAFKAWLISIAANKCNDYFREKARTMQLSIEELSEVALSTGRLGLTEETIVRDTLDLLGEKEKQILYLYYFKNLSQEDISRRLSIPLGTVKSRLHYAKESFKKNYPYPPKSKGEITMKKLPAFLPEYKIEPSTLPPFTVKCEELMGFCVIPRLGEKITWGSYDIPSRKRSDYTDVAVVGKAEIHGIEGVEIRAIQHDETEGKTIERQLVAQLTDTHCRYLAESHFENGVKKTFTFLDSDVFMNNWGFGENNCGYETYLHQKDVIKRAGADIKAPLGKELLDIVGRYTVTINNKHYDTVCIMDVGHFDGKIAIEQYLDQNGRTILWRRFNRNDWATKRYGKLWTELLPNNERFRINCETYVHWYDCVTDYIF